MEEGAEAGTGRKSPVLAQVYGVALVTPLLHFFYFQIPLFHCIDNNSMKYTESKWNLFKVIT